MRLKTNSILTNYVLYIFIMFYLEITYLLRMNKQNPIKIAFKQIL